LPPGSAANPETDERVTVERSTRADPPDVGTARIRVLPESEIYSVVPTMARAFGAFSGTEVVIGKMSDEEPFEEALMIAFAPASAMNKVDPSVEVTIAVGSMRLTESGNAVVTPPVVAKTCCRRRPTVNIEPLGAKATPPAVGKTLGAPEFAHAVFDGAPPVSVKGESRVVGSEFVVADLPDAFEAVTEKV